MRRWMMTVVGMVLAGGAFASPIGDALRPIAGSGKVPGICTAVCDAKGKVTVDCVGYANIEKKTPITENTIFWIASDTKGIAGTLVLTFIQEGKIGLDDPVEKYFPGWKELYVCEKLPDGKYGPRRRATTKPTVRNLISHTAGLPFLPGGPIDTRSMSLMANMVPSRNLVCEPNTKYNYSNWGIDCALAIVELVTGRPWEVSLQERILDPLGMKTATFWPKEDDAPGAVLATAYVMDTNRVDYLKPVKTVNMRHPYDDPHRYAEGGGGLFMSTRDYMKFCKMLLDGGKTPDGKTILNDASMKMLLTKQTPDCEKTSYGFGFFSDVANRRLWHGGAFNTGYSIDFKNHTAEVFHWQAPGNNADTKSARAIYYQAMRRFLSADARFEDDSPEPPKRQARAEILWSKPICVEPGRYIGWPTVRCLANGDLAASAQRRRPRLSELLPDSGRFDCHGLLPAEGPRREDLSHGDQVADCPVMEKKRNARAR